MFLWQVPGKPVAIYITFDVVDRLLQDVMRGFGAVPKRGAEVGGVLAGRRQTENGFLTVEVVDYELVPIEYRRGPSYLMSAVDRAAFEEAFGRLKSGAKDGLQAIGMFRSHTRDSVGLAPEDHEVLDALFAGPENIVLLIRPFGTRVSMAGFYFKEGGRFPDGPPLLDFPFRPKDLGDETKPLRRTPSEDRPFVREAGGMSSNAAGSEYDAGLDPEPGPGTAVLSLRDRPPQSQVPEIDLRSKGGSGWVWLPLSFIFLLLGVLLGFQAALTLRPQAAVLDPYSIALKATRNGGNLNIVWDRQSPAIRAATGGILMIEDGAFSKPISLTNSDLQTGSVVYPPNSNHVTFRLELTFSDLRTMAEKLEWRE